MKTKKTAVASAIDYVEKLKNHVYANLTVIASLANVKLNYNYVITDYSLLKPTPGNRGGMENKRIKDFIKLIKSGLFDIDLYIVQVDVNGMIVEGHHKYEAFKALGLPIRITIVPPKTVIQISRVHSGTNPNWKPEQEFQSAITIGCKVAIELQKEKSILCEKYRIDKSKLKAPEMYGIMMESTKYFTSGKNSPNVGMWADADHALITKKEFKKNLRLYAQMKSELKNVRDAYKVAKCVMDLHFNKLIKFDLEGFCNALVYEGFVLKIYNTKTIREAAIALYNKEMRHKKVA